MPTKVNITAWTKYWRLIVIDEALSRVTPWWTVKRYFSCQCECWTIKEYMMTHLRSWRIKSCGCYHLEVVKWAVWEKSSQWKWWWRELNKIIRESLEYKSWRKACFERDNYTCQITGEKWWDLVVHHIKPFYSLISDIDLEDYKEDDNLWGIENWITLTKEIHILFHKKYWTKEFSSKNFTDFKKGFTC